SLGGGGRLCVIAAAWIRLFPATPALASAWSCPDVAAAVSALELVCQRRLAPARARILVGADGARLALAWEGVESAAIERDRAAPVARQRSGLGSSGRGRRMAAAGRGAGSRGVTALQRAQELCEFCPQMCRFACPVSEAARREALTPWAKASLAALSAREPDASAALAFAGCTGCDRCAHHCAHGNDVKGILFAARATAVRAGVAPRPCTEL